jgi:quercetin dioxygenase-like cupin family protein
MTKAHVLRFDTLHTVERGNGVKTTLLVGKEIGASGLTSGLTRFPPGGAIPLHFHNCPEQVTIIEGDAEVEIAGERSRVGRYDTTYIPAGMPHRFTNAGTGLLVILWIYGSSDVTRTFVDTGETVAHLSSRDRAANL